MLDEKYVLQDSIGSFIYSRSPDALVVVIRKSEYHDAIPNAHRVSSGVKQGPMQSV